MNLLQTILILLLPILSQSQQICPCICRTGPIARVSTMNECRLAALSPFCQVNSCTRRNGLSGFFCCDPTPTPTPTSTPSPSPSPTPSAPVICPCICRTGFRQTTTAISECSTASPGCTVQSCTRGRSTGTFCCNASPSPTPSPTPSPSSIPCPCICRSGINQVATAVSECAMSTTPDRCVVGTCLRPNGAFGTSCCDPDMITSLPSPSASLTVSVSAAPSPSGVGPVESPMESVLVESPEASVEVVLGTPDVVVGTPDELLGTPDMVIVTPDFAMSTPDIVVSTPQIGLTSPSATPVVIVTPPAGGGVGPAESAEVSAEITVEVTSEVTLEVTAEEGVIETAEVSAEVTEEEAGV